MKESEKTVEACLRREVKKRGGLCYKFVSPQSAGVPDRIIISPGGRVLFVEVKSNIGRLTPAQKRQHQKLEERGATVKVVRSTEEVKDLFRDEDKKRGI